jgi:hypothetical protein
MNAMATVQQIAPVHERTSMMSAYVTLCYVALSVPVIVAGQAADRFGLTTVTVLYFVAVTVVVAIALRLAGSTTTTRKGDGHVAAAA